MSEGNQFGHPADNAAERYAQAGVRFLRTGRDGAVTTVTDGCELVVRTLVEEHPHGFEKHADKKTRGRVWLPRQKANF